MGKPKSTLKRAYLDKAKARHTCRRNKDHVIHKGEARLNIKEGRSISRYCLMCAKASIDNDIKALTSLSSEISSDLQESKKT